MYQAHYINPLIQFGFAEFDLILTDDTGILPEVRLHKCFPAGVTAAMLDVEATREVIRLTESVQADVDVTAIDLPEGKELGE